MTNREKHDPNSREYTNALLEDIEDKFQIVLEATAPIPEMRKQINGLTDKVENMDTTMESWEKHIKLIPAIFEEVGSLRRDVEIIKEAMKLLDRHDSRLDKIEQRLSAVEQHVR